MKHWVGIQQGESYLRLASLALVSHPSSDSATIKIIHGVDAYYIYQPSTPSFPIGLVKTESHVIVRSVETGFRRKILILFWLSQTFPVTLRIQEKVFSGCTVLPDSEETKPGSSNQEAPPLADKNTGVVLVPCNAHGSVSLQLFPMMWIF